MPVRQIITRRFCTHTSRRLILYTDDSCPPCIAVQMTAHHLGVKLHKKHLNLVGWEHMKPDFLKINPQHCVPTLIEGSLTLWDSHAIMPYLTMKYDENHSSLYPDQLKFKIQQFLHFDSSILFARLRFLGEPIFYYKSPIEPRDKIEYVFKGIKLLETILVGKEYLVGDQLTLADLSCVSTMETLKYMVKVPMNDFPNIQRWMKNLEQLPYYELNKKCAALFEKMYRDAIEENKLAFK